MRIYGGEMEKIPDVSLSIYPHFFMLRLRLCHLTDIVLYTKISGKGPQDNFGKYIAY